MILFRSRDLTAAALLFALASLLCTQIPLLNYLGFEFSFFISLLVSIVCGVITIRSTRSGLRQDPPHAWPSLFRRVLTANFVLLVIPLIVMLTNAIFVKNCSFLQGLGFYILLPVVTTWLVSCFGAFCAVHYRFSKAIYFLLFGLTILYAVAIGYYTPALFSYNFFYGYFPGLTYDEQISINWALVLFRLLTIAVGGVFFWMSAILVAQTGMLDSTWKKGAILLKALTRGWRSVVSIVIFVTAIVIYAFKGELGLESHSGFVQDRLGSKYETEHFTIYYSKKSYTEDEIEWVAAEHEFRLQQILSTLNILPKERIASYIYPTSTAKQRLIGAGTTNIAKPWSRQVHISRQSLDETLKHELIHVVAGRFGLPVIHASASTGLVEGLAMAIEWDWGGRTLHQYAAALRKFGIFPDIQQLMMLTGFAAQSSSVSYVLAGSFCRYLIDRYGIRPMMQVYGSGDYEKLYGRSLAELIKEWHGFLDRIPVEQKDADVVDASFRRPAIFHKVCARVVAERNADARREFQRRNYASAAELYQASYFESWNQDALAGYLASELRLGHYASLTAALDTIIMREDYPARFVGMFVNIGDAFWGEGSRQKARELYTRAACAELSELYTEAALLRSYAVDDSVHGRELFRHFTSDASDTVRLEMLDSLVEAKGWLVPYLRGRTLYRLNRFGEAADVLSGLSIPDSTLEAVRLKTIGKALFRLKKFQEAKPSFWLSLNAVSSAVAANEVNDWIERCDWTEAYFSHPRQSARPSEP